MKFEENKDGSVIVVLEDGEILTLGGELVDRLTIPALTGKHLRLAPWSLDKREVTMGELAEWAARIVVPAKAYDELPIAAARDLALRCGHQMGKSRATGAGS